jgi:hypothetical protein
MLLYEDTPVYDAWVKYIIGGILALTLIIGMVLLAFDTAGAVAMFIITVFDAVLFRLILPRRFQVYEDRLKIVLGGPFVINIPFTDIVKAEPAPASRTMIYWGLRLATSTRHVVEIDRRHGLSVVISPANEDIFLTQLDQARRVYSGING